MFSGCISFSRFFFIFESRFLLLDQSKPRNCRSYFEIIAHSFKTADCVAAYHIVQLVYRRLVSIWLFVCSLESFSLNQIYPTRVPRAILPGMARGDIKVVD